MRKKEDEGEGRKIEKVGRREEGEASKEEVEGEGRKGGGGHLSGIPDKG